MRMSAWRGVIFAAAMAGALIVAGRATVPMLQATGDSEIGPDSGPSAPGTPANPHLLPTDAGGQVPGAGGEIPRLYPEPTTFEQEKARANAQATMTATSEGEAP